MNGSFILCGQIIISEEIAFKLTFESQRRVSHMEIKGRAVILGISNTCAEVLG